MSSREYIYAAERMLGKRVLDSRMRNDRYGMEFLMQDRTIHFVQMYELERWVDQFRSRERQERMMAYMPQIQNLDIYSYKGQQLSADYMDAMMYGMKVYKQQEVAPKPRCKNCSEEHETVLDHHGFCQKQQQRFWAKVRRLYWHRHLTTK